MLTRVRELVVKARKSSLKDQALAAYKYSTLSSFAGPTINIITVVNIFSLLGFSAGVGYVVAKNKHAPNKFIRKLMEPVDSKKKISRDESVAADIKTELIDGHGNWYLLKGSKGAGKSHLAQEIADTTQGVGLVGIQGGACPERLNAAIVSFLQVPKKYIDMDYFEAIALKMPYRTKGEELFYRLQSDANTAAEIIKQQSRGRIRPTLAFDDISKYSRECPVEFKWLTDWANESATSSKGMRIMLVGSGFEASSQVEEKTTRTMVEFVLPDASPSRVISTLKKRFPNVDEKEIVDFVNTVSGSNWHLVPTSEPTLGKIRARVYEEAHLTLDGLDAPSKAMIDRVYNGEVLSTSLLAYDLQDSKEVLSRTWFEDRQTARQLLARDVLRFDGKQLTLNVAYRQLWPLYRKK